MDILELMKQRHSVRSYLDKPISADLALQLKAAAAEINAQSGLHIQPVLNEPRAFSGLLAHYGRFRNVSDYLMLAGPADAGEQIGYWGEKLVLELQRMGLNTCWVAMSYKHGAVKPALGQGEKLHIVIAMGYGASQGTPHRSKAAEKVAQVGAEDPDWYRRGVEAALLAPTAVNQQRFFISRKGERGVVLESRGGPCAQIDLGIVKYHFEAGAGSGHFDWA